jgi:hypothetical protein
MQFSAVLLNERYIFGIGISGKAKANNTGKSRGVAKRKKTCARKGRGGAKMEKWTFLRLGREEEGEMDMFGDYKQTELTQTDGNPNIPRRAWLIIQKERVQNKKSMCQKWRLKTDDG